MYIIVLSHACLSLIISVLLPSMRLRNIKLSGFKSFVDPTTLTVPGNLVGVVGPNGCGKSNIIDAVMWVMGESSAKHLRGDALTDVIFNGSSARNPVGQASVELIFDNTEDKIGGQYASYDEISIKRQINRDAISTYYLNGTRCRRKDITAIFLGTGLGPRSYAIIEQGMISRLIEAKPEELRSFIEEAAGISKYRERRRETENRIKHTKENIYRINDIREELDKQLKHLQRQARAAERYQEMKKEERQLEAQLHALNWRKLKQRSEKEGELVRAEENKVEAAVADLRRTEAGIEQHREKLTSANDGFNQQQSNFYRVGGEISQLEQKIQHAHERINNLEDDLAKAKAEEHQAQAQQHNDNEKLIELSARAKELEPKLHGSRDESDKAYSSLNQSESAMQSWQTEWDTFNETASEYSRQKEISQTRAEHLELNIEDVQERIQALSDELAEIDHDVFDKKIRQHSDQLQAAEQQLKQINNEIENSQKRLQAQRKDTQLLTDELNAKQMQQQKLEGRLTSLDALQQSALGQDQEDAIQWLKRTGLTDNLRLAQQIKVEAKWTQAVEMVLGDSLQDVCVDDLDKFTSKLATLKNGNLGLISPAKAKHHGNKNKGLQLLADKIQSDIAVDKLLAGIYIAEDIETAMKIRNRLDDNESVVTADAMWLGPHWTRMFKGDHEQAGTLSREQEIKQLQTELESSEIEIEKSRKLVTASQQQVEKSEQRLQQLQAELSNQQETISTCRTQLATGETQYEQTQSRAEQIQDEIEQLNEQLAEDKQEYAGIQKDLERVTSNYEELELQRDELKSQRDKYRDLLDKARAAWQQTHETSHGIALQLESISSQRASLEQSLKRNELQIKHLQTRCEELVKSLEETRAPIKDQENKLAAMLEQKVTAEKALADARSVVQQTENELREQEQQRTSQEHKIQSLREELEKVRIATQESRVRLQTIEEQLKSSNHDLKALLDALPEDATIEKWQEQLESVNRKITRLGPINLAAIDEYTQLSERKNYLDDQHEDLEKALNTLESAIRKIDKESRARFKDTFDRLNTNLQDTFPRLFGGGHASLELIGDDLLETGVTVMARPPGKRNSTIHLLSGGEKALTAVALVFSIFKLNPAPFCILDEVDAPLDDANVGRFSELVANMSKDVQFIFITHNKITMEIANQLLGVTMHEAGVSRLVSVDVEEAVELAATA